MALSSDIDEIQRMREEMTSLANENAALKSHRVYAREINALRQQCLRYASEHAAMRAILENKLKTLVDALAVHISTPNDSHHPTPLQKQVRALQKLVDASINALQSPKEDNMTGTTTASEQNALTSMAERRRKELTSN
jgi:hypothetical protein